MQRRIPAILVLCFLGSACRPPAVSQDDPQVSPPDTGVHRDNDSDPQLNDTGRSDTADTGSRIPGQASWTLMIFMAGDNNLESSALGDLNELERVGSSDEVNVLVQLDRSRHYSSADGDWSGSRRYRVEQDDDTSSIGSSVLDELGETDSGDPDTVAAFASWAIQSYPADRYGLVMWNHGWGWSLAATAATKGLSSDYDSGNDISVAEGELEAILSAAHEQIGAPLDLLGIDACLMGSWEVSHVAAPHADVYVASQANEGLDGWAYDTTLADLVADPDMDGAALGEVIALRFNETFDSTQSVVDLAVASDLASALDTLAQAMMDTGQAGALLDDGATQAQDFETGVGADHDIGDFLDKLEASSHADGAVLSAIEGLREVYDTAVIANYTWGNDVRDATGMSIYTPTYGQVDSDYGRGRWAEETLWDEFLELARNGN